MLVDSRSELQRTKEGQQGLIHLWNQYDSETLETSTYVDLCRLNHLSADCSLFGKAGSHGESLLDDGIVTGSNLFIRST